MTGKCISTERILSKLDEYFGKNDYASAERHILYWIDEAKAMSDKRTTLLLQNELMGLYRKLSKKEEALKTVEAALEMIGKMGIENNVGAGTTYLNSATVFKAFDMPEKALSLFEKTMVIYERELNPDDKRFGGLYNNMALALVDNGRFDEAYLMYDKAISVMSKAENGELEVAITYLNIASAKEEQLGAIDSCDAVNELLEKAMIILDNHPNKDGYYAFVCDKCASVFGYFGYFAYENDLNERARRIYEGS